MTKKATSVRDDVVTRTVALYQGAHEALNALCEANDVSLTHLIECLSKCTKEEVGEIVRAHSAAVQADRAAASKARLALRRAERARARELAKKLERLTPEQLAKVESVLGNA